MSGDLAARRTTPTARRDPTTRSALRGWLLTGVAAVGFLLAALVLSAYLGAAFGVQTALLALAVALVPLGIVIPTFLWLDRFESEPTRYLVGAFLWGALVAAVVAALFNTGAIAVLEATVDPQSAQQTTAVLIAPFVEEAAKGALVLVVWWTVRREFDGVTDGMVYAGICAAGFAFTENIQYLAQVVVYLLVEVPIFLAFLGFVGWARRREGHLIGQFLRPYADAGWLSAAEVAMLSSMPRRREARAWARANTGREGLAAMRAFQDTASELALLRRRMHHCAADELAVAHERELLEALRVRRAQFVGTPGS